MNVDYSAYEGRKIKGVVETVLSRGSVVIDKGEFKGKAGAGSLLNAASVWQSKLRDSQVRSTRARWKRAYQSNSQYGCTTLLSTLETSARNAGWSIRLPTVSVGGAALNSMLDPSLL